MNLTLSVDEHTLLEARRKAEALGTSVNQLVRDYLEALAGKSDIEATVAELEVLSRKSLGSSSGWKFNRDELHER